MMFLVNEMINYILIFFSGIYVLEIERIWEFELFIWYGDGLININEDEVFDRYIYYINK